MVIHQLVPNFVPGDATGQAALHFQLLCRRLGHTGQLYGAEVHPSLQRLVLPASHLRPQPQDWVLYHHGIASSLSGQLLHLPCRKGLIFHNISPSHMYLGTPLHEALVQGRAQLAAMTDWVELAIGVSDFNSNELRAAGYDNVHTVPLFLEPQRFAATQPDAALSERLAKVSPYVLSVSRVVPHKRFEDTLAFFRELRRIRPDVHCVIAGGYAAGEPYFRKLKREAEAIGQVTFLGKVTNSELIAAYRNASLFLSMSEHEGFGVPFLEAFACDVPVMAYAAAAVPETLGERGIAFTEKNFAYLAELAREVLENASLRQSLVQGQQARLRQLSAKSAEAALKKALLSVEKPPRRIRKPSWKPQIGLVVQRYGEDIVGGAEAHARSVAQRMSAHWDVTVLTSCARDHLTWANDYPQGESTDGPVKVIRFPSVTERRMTPFNALSRSVFGRPLDRLSEENWVAAQGPLVPELLQHLSHPATRYDGYLFFTYLYAPTVWGLPLVADKALLVPTAHDEPPFWMDTYLDVFELPRVLMCNTPEEVTLIRKRTAQAARTRVVGVGVEPLPAEAERFRARFNLTAPYLMYVGRVEEGKGVGELLRFHQQLKAQSNAIPDLVLAGASSIEVQGKGVHYFGRISEQEKFDGLKGAVAAVVPSRFESLSLLTLEALSVGTPVVGHSGSEVVAGHIHRSTAGETYNSLESFEKAISRVQSHDPPRSSRARAYALRYQWPAVVQAYIEEMNFIIKERT